MALTLNSLVSILGLELLLLWQWFSELAEHLQVLTWIRYGLHPRAMVSALSFLSGLWMQDAAWPLAGVNLQFRYPHFGAHIHNWCLSWHHVLDLRRGGFGT